MAYKINGKYFDENYKEIAEPTSGNITSVNTTAAGKPASLDYLSDPSTAGYMGLSKDVLTNLYKAAGVAIPGATGMSVLDESRAIVDAQDAWSRKYRESGYNPSGITYGTPPPEKPITTSVPEIRSEEHTSELQSQSNLVFLLL